MFQEARLLRSMPAVRDCGAGGHGSRHEGAGTGDGSRQRTGLRYDISDRLNATCSRLSAEQAHMKTCGDWYEAR